MALFSFLFFLAMSFKRKVRKRGLGLQCLIIRAFLRLPQATTSGEKLSVGLSCRSGVRKRYVFYVIFIIRSYERPALFQLDAELLGNSEMNENKIA